MKTPEDIKKNKTSIFLGTVIGLVATGFGSSGLLAILKYREGDPAYLVIWLLGVAGGGFILHRFYKEAKKLKIF